MTFQPTRRPGIETTNMNLKTDKWWSLRGSNPLPPTCKAGALTHERRSQNDHSRLEISGKAGNRNRTRDLLLGQKMVYLRVTL